MSNDLSTCNIHTCHYIPHEHLGLECLSKAKPRRRADGQPQLETPQVSSPLEFWFVRGAETAVFGTHRMNLHAGSGCCGLRFCSLCWGDLCMPDNLTIRQHTGSEVQVDSLWSFLTLDRGSVLS